eukprot:1384107-Amphidinium_carterae.2
MEAELEPHMLSLRRLWCRSRDDLKLVQLSCAAEHSSESGKSIHCCGILNETPWYQNHKGCIVKTGRVSWMTSLV